MPKDESGGTLRGLLRSISAAISAEFCTVALVNSQLVLCAEAEMSSNGKAFLDQFHRGISCPIEQFEEFENACAQGMLFSKKISFETPIQMLPGFARVTAWGGA